MKSGSAPSRAPADAVAGVIGALSTDMLAGMSAEPPRSRVPTVPGSRGQEPRRRTAAPPVPRKVRIPHLHAMKAEGRKWAMLTAYDMYAAQIFDEAGIPVLLVGDSAGNNVYGYETTVPVTLDEMIPLVRAVVVGRAPARSSWPTCRSAPTARRSSRASRAPCAS